MVWWTFLLSSYSRRLLIMFFKKTVDGIIADIEKKIASLHIVAELHTKEAEAHAEVIKLRTEAHNDFVKLKTELVAKAEAEIARAKAIAEKFKALIHV